MATSMYSGGDSHVNGSNGTAHSSSISKRFSDIPSHIDIPVQGDEEEDQIVTIDLAELLDDPIELCYLLENEKAAHTLWMTVSLAYATERKVDNAIDVLIRGLSSIERDNKEKLSMLTCLCWLYLCKTREARRVPVEGEMAAEAKIKEWYLQKATSTLNEASRINPTFPPLFLARGVLYLLRASLQPPPKTADPNNADSEKMEILRMALKSFGDALQVSHGRNIMAVLGRSRTLFSMGRYADALAGYQEALLKMPELADPDPRIGIGCCLWMLDHKDDACLAWERALEINPKSKIATILLGLYHLHNSSQLATNTSEFVESYKKAMTEYTQSAFKLDKDQPLTCATFASFFLARKALDNAGTLAHKAIQFTDVNAIASDGWYMLARKEHYSGNEDVAVDYYRRSDEARGGVDRGFLPAKFGAAQLSVLKGDFGEAKLRLEKTLQGVKNIEAMTLLGTIYSEEVFANQYATTKEDKAVEFKKATGLLESVRTSWKDSKKQIVPDLSVLLNLARLYEVEHADKSLQCLSQVEQLEFDSIPVDSRPTDPDEVANLRNKIRSNLPPQLLNNMGCFHFVAEHFDQAMARFQDALNACLNVNDKDKHEDIDTDALVTTISFNLARTYEVTGLFDEARTVYEGLLSRHPDYTDARTRLSYIALRQSPSDAGPKSVSKLYAEANHDLEVRALYGWYLGKVHSRKRPANIAEDQELRHYKHTLQNYEKHDRYALIGMGNIYLQTAREMRRDSDADKQKRSNMYSKAVEFFDKALQLDSKNAYAAQGIAIAMAEDKKDFQGALKVLLKVKETVKDPNIYVNLGHTYAELRQYARAIENYEVALSKDRSHDAQILACLGRTWLARARMEKSLPAYRSALDYSQKALEVAPEQVHLKFNVAFVQIQLALAVYGMAETTRTLTEVTSAADGLEDAIIALEAIAEEPYPPYPKNAIEARANMARNTMRKQLERAVASQKEHEDKIAEKLQDAIKRREAEQAKKAEAQRKVEEAEAARKRALAEDRAKLLAEGRIISEARAREAEDDEQKERRRNAHIEAMYTDDENGERVLKPAEERKAMRATTRRTVEDLPDNKPNKVKRNRKKGRAATASGDEEEESARPKKKSRLVRKDTTGKFKSAEVVVDSDSDVANSEANRATTSARNSEAPDTDLTPAPESEVATGTGAEQDDEVVAPAKRGARNRVVDSDDEDGSGGGALLESPRKSDPDAQQGDADDVAMDDEADANSIFGGDSE